jgi:predicted ATP-grasp superfamily ATP-dependent carboligase
VAGSQNRVKILLSEGSSTSARQTLYGLGRDYIVDIVDPSPWCQCRFSSLVRRWYRCPLMAEDPAGYVTFVADLLRRHGHDVLFPTHEQVYLFSRFRDLLGPEIGVALPHFQSLRRLQGKADFARLFDELSLPLPETHIAHGEAELLAHAPLPGYVKLAHSTASLGVRLVRNQQELRDAIAHFKALGLWSDGAEVLMQSPASGRQSEATAVFQHGRLVAAACAEVLETGIGGGPSRRISASHPPVVEHLRRLGSSLNWHGPLSLEYFYDFARQQPQYIEANPRIGETTNALISGVNLCDLVVRISQGQHVDEVGPGRVGVKTHTGFIVLLAAAYNGANRRQLLRRWWRMGRGHSEYGSCENEMTRPREDWGSLIPATATLLRIFAFPQSARALSRNTIYNYSLPQSAVSAIHDLPDDAEPAS